ncbi:unnamed protein product [Rangifer tarandus platyrhynchus]|uniref:Uncharacterized protein n=2 Tax=Rangifer tarandus platyrhynchus TaxID=3082113 RepID=A0AC59ZMP5_RANTA|nr:unnamed protein product [Rangifer tarandus platyrhynchus]
MAILATMYNHLPKKNRGKSLSDRFEFLMKFLEPFDLAVLRASFIALNFLLSFCGEMTHSRAEIMRYAEVSESKEGPPKITEVCENDTEINLKDCPMAKSGAN